MRPYLLIFVFGVVFSSCRKDTTCNSSSYIGEYVGIDRYQYYPQKTEATIGSSFEKSFQVSCSALILEIGTKKIDFNLIQNDAYSEFNSIDGNGGTSSSLRFVGDSLYYRRTSWWWGYDHVYSFAGKKLP